MLYNQAAFQSTGAVHRLSFPRLRRRINAEVRSWDLLLERLLVVVLTLQSSLPTNILAMGNHPVCLISCSPPVTRVPPNSCGCVWRAEHKCHLWQWRPVRDCSTIKTCISACYDMLLFLYTGFRPFTGACIDVNWHQWSSESQRLLAVFLQHLCCYSSSGVARIPPVRTCRSFPTHLFFEQQERC